LYYGNGGRGFPLRLPQLINILILAFGYIATNDSKFEYKEEKCMISTTDYLQI
jgi:hypothetical protein